MTYITQFLSIAISFVYVPIMLRMLGQAEYGLYSIVHLVSADVRNGYRHHCHPL